MDIKTQRIKATGPDHKTYEIVLRSRVRTERYLDGKQAEVTLNGQAHVVVDGREYPINRLEKDGAVDIFHCDHLGMKFRSE